MKYAKYLMLTVALFALSAFAADRDRGSMNLPDPAVVGSAHLKPGDYKVEWNGTGKHVTVNFMQHGKTLATTSAELVNHSKPSPYNDVVLNPATGKNKRIDEIDFNNRTEALVLRPSVMAKSNAMPQAK